MDMKLTAASLRFRAGMGGDAAIYSVAGTVPNLNAGNLISRLGTTEATRMTLLDWVMTW
jgi:hypothetical protein